MLMTRSDNLQKTQMHNPKGYIFSYDSESVHHLLVGSIVAHQIWHVIVAFFQVPVGNAYEYIDRFLVAKKAYSFKLCL